MGKDQNEQKLHDPVLRYEVVEVLEVKSKAHLKKYPKYIDATAGLGGHVIEIVKLGGSVLGVDADWQSLKLAEMEINKACPSHLSRKVGRYKLVHGNFRDIKEIADKNGFLEVEGILFDLGISKLQISSASKGFSFLDESAPLDMRMDQTEQAVKAADLLNVLNIGQLEALFTRVLSKRASKKIAKEIVLNRGFKKFEKVGDFLRAVSKVIGESRVRGLHPATLPFLALRIAVNSEIENLEGALPSSFDLLGKKGRLVVISFHSGEDRVVKEFFRKMELKGEGKIVFKKPIVPKKVEVERNPSARSAKMRVIEKNGK
jgi:16S rRNA (cytosine1402-N4)-methyltransferase